MNADQFWGDVLNSADELMQIKTWFEENAGISLEFNELIAVKDDLREKGLKLVPKRKKT